MLIIALVFTIFNLGPQHPSTHGVLSLMSMLSGEMIQWTTQEMGLLHSGTEKFMESNYWSSSVIPYFDRLDYVSTVTQELLCMQMLEKLMNCYCSSFMSMWRSLLLEFYSNLNHNLNITTHAIDIGLFTTMLWTFEESEKLINFNECISGTSFHATFILIGSLSYDISLFWIDAFVYWLIHYSSQLKEIHNILSMNQLWSTSLYEMGIVSKVFCLYFGLSGLLSRSANMMIDASLTGFEFYQCLKYSLFISSIGDCLDSYMLRMNEIIESCRIIYAVIYPVVRSFYFMCYSYFIMYLMELLIEEFLMSFPLILSFIIEFKCSMESSKGIYSIYMQTFPYFTFNMMTNDYLAMNQLNKFTRYINLGDLVVLLGSMDFVLGSVDL